LSDFIVIVLGYAAAAVLVAVLISITDRSARSQQERQAFDAQLLVSERGPGMARQARQRP
jgi:hypothetical protein